MSQLARILQLQTRASVQVSIEDRTAEVMAQANLAHVTAAATEYPLLRETDVSPEAMQALKDSCSKRAAAILLCNMDVCVQHNAAESKELYPWLAEMYFGPGRSPDSVDLSPLGALTRHAVALPFL
jgi:hypothetical protein